jgi:hypothetical protein
MSTEICNAEIKIALLEANANLDTTYDYSHVIIASHADVNDSIAFEGTKIYAPHHAYGYEMDEEELKEKQENEKKLDIAIEKIKLSLLKNNCMVMSSYDYSSVIIIDSFGNSKALKG